eukprot:357243-Chlamydomonas_euryale.AAC.4
MAAFAWQGRSWCSARRAHATLAAPTSLSGSRSRMRCWGNESRCGSRRRRGRRCGSPAAGCRAAALWIACGECSGPTPGRTRRDRGAPACHRDSTRLPPAAFGHVLPRHTRFGHPNPIAGPVGCALRVARRERVQPSSSFRVGRPARADKPRPR